MPVGVSDIPAALDQAMAASPKRRRRLTTRLRVALRRRSLDHSLADGADPRTSSLLELRAAQLTSDGNREILTDSLAKVLAEARRRPRWSAAVPIDRKAVAESRLLLIQISALLQSEQPVFCQGMAMLERLLTDGASALYGQHGKGALSEELERMIVALEGG